MIKTKLGAITARVVKKDFKITIEKFVASGSVFSFMSSIKGTPAYWKQFLYDVIAIVRQTGIPKYFLLLSCADPRWEERPYFIKKLNNLGFSDEKLKNLSYLERCNLLNNNPILATGHF